MNSTRLGILGLALIAACAFFVWPPLPLGVVGAVLVWLSYVNRGDSR